MGETQVGDRILTAAVEYAMEQKTVAPNSALSLATQTWANLLIFLHLRFLICIDELL